MVRFTIDGAQTEVAEGTTLLQAARELGLQIPTLCHHDRLAPYGGCRLCLVDVGGKLLPSCITRAAEGMTVITDSERVRSARQFIIKLLLSRSPDSLELQEIARGLGVRFGAEEELDAVSTYLFRRAQNPVHTLCIRCGLCVRVCAEVPKRFALSFSGRGMKRVATSPFRKVAESCIGCGSCAHVCPTNAITIEEVT